MYFALLFQLFPSLFSTLVWSLDVRNWSRQAWIGVNVLVVVVLFGIRFRPQLYADLKKRRKCQPMSNERQQKSLSLKQERELYRRMNEARKRQIV